MKQNTFPNKSWLVIVTIVSTILAIPGGFGGLFLLNAGFGQLSDFNVFGLLVASPPIIGFSLLFGYYWTLFSRRVVKWFWICSAVFNLIITFAAVIFLFFIGQEIKENSLFLPLIFIFSCWTGFAAYVSLQFARVKNEGASVDLP